MKAKTMLKSKTGNIGKLAQVAIFGLVGLVVLFEIAAAVVPTAQTAGTTLNATGIPLGSFFTSTGIVFLLIAVGLLVAAIKLSGVSRK